MPVRRRHVFVSKIPSFLHWVPRDDSNPSPRELRPSALDRTDQTEASNRQPYDERPPTDDTASEG